MPAANCIVFWPGDGAIQVELDEQASETVYVEVETQEDPDVAAIVTIRTAS